MAENENPQDYNLDPRHAEIIAAHFDLSPSEFRAQKKSLQKAILQFVQHPDRPSARADHFLKFHQGDDGEINHDGKADALDRLKETRGAPQARHGILGGVPGGQAMVGPAPMVMESRAGLVPDNTGWKALGPGNIGGRIRSIIIDPNNSSTIYIGSVGGGVWITTDGGSSWNPADDLMANLAVCSMAMDPTNSSIIYAGTGEGYYNGDAIAGNGIFKTSDGWVWEQLEATKVTSTNRDFQWVNGLAISSNGQTLVAGLVPAFIDRPMPGRPGRRN